MDLAAPDRTRTWTGVLLTPERADELRGHGPGTPPAGHALGIHRFPGTGRGGILGAAKIAVQTIESPPTAVEHVRLVAFDQATRDLLQAALNA
jgi:hypothetical protein